MSFLNQLGANVRNHMSTIEDNFVDQARHHFPAAPKKSRIGGAIVAPPTTGGKTTPPKPVITAENRADQSRFRTGQAANMPGTAKPNATPSVSPAQPVRSTTGQTPPKSRPTQSRPTQSRPTQSRPTQSRPTQSRPTQSRPTQSRPTQSRPTQSRPTQSRPAQPRPTETVKTPGAVTSPTNHKGEGQRQKGNAAKSREQRAVDPAARRDIAKNNRQAGEKPHNKQFTKPQNAPKNAAPSAGGGQAERKPGNNRPSSRPQPGARSQSNQQRPQQQGANGKGNNRWSKSSRNNQRGKNRSVVPSRHPILQKPKGPATNVKSVQLPAHMTVKDFAQLMELAAGDIIKKLMGLGVMATINQEIDFDTMTLIAQEFGVTATAAPTEEEKVQVEEIEDDPADLVKRSPVVTIMGHVDHGKTSLLDAIRETHVTAQEAGGITQHIGAYQVELKERKITFLDTPGHAAFTAMRARGAQVTDIAVLVVAADDGVMPQTIEAVNHAKDANVSIIVAINKIDKPGANPDRVKQDLTEYGLVAEEWGGETIFVPVSAKQRIGIENLLEMILLVADMKELKANPNRSAKGTIIEAELDKGRGPVAAVLVQNGTLELGNSIIAGAAFGKVRALINDKGKRVKKAGPSIPVEVIGFDELPEAGDILYAITDERLARQLADKRMQLKRESELLQTQKVTLSDLFSKIKEGEIKELKLIVKADVQGSIEAIRQSLERLSNEEVKVKVIHGGVGAINEGDVTFAAAANAIVIGFNVRPDSSAKRMAEKENVDIQLYRVIYNIIGDVQKAMEGMLDPEFKEVVVGRAEVRAVYKVPKVGNIAGCYIVEGKINRNHEIRLLRDNIVIHEGKIESLKRFKDDVREVAEGFECGMGIANFNDIKEGDAIEAFLMEEIKRQ
jgi:translation initiation factor IF-2